VTQALGGLSGALERAVAPQGTPVPAPPQADGQRALDAGPPPAAVPHANGEAVERR
jgi:hypothetical protein